MNELEKTAIQALGALEFEGYDERKQMRLRDAVNALKEALSKDDELFGYVVYNKKWGDSYFVFDKPEDSYPSYELIPVYKRHQTNEG